MLRTHWNRLRVGDHVTLHDHGRLGSLTDAVIVSVVPQREGNDVQIKLDDGTLLYPRRWAIHLAGAAGGHCWRCSDTRAPASRDRDHEHPEGTPPRPG